MFSRVRMAACGLAALLAGAGLALADDHSYSEGPVVTVSSIRTLEGRFDDYMKWIDTVWKAEQAAAKKAGYITDYAVYLATPRGPDDPDVLLVTTYKNWAAFDGGLAKSDAISKQIEGSVQAANQADADRNKIRRVLGTSILQQAMLK
jgi:hypothetical protein